MANCKQCNKQLPEHWHTDICMECSEANVRKIFREHPDVKECFRETLDDLRKPENVKKMAEDFTKVAKQVSEVIQQAKAKNNTNNSKKRRL